MNQTIELSRVSKYYANENAVSLGFSKVDLTLNIGEFVVITGESGSGKSTLLNVISGLDNYDEGVMKVCGEDTSSYGTEEYERYRKNYICNIFQEFNLVNSYTVYQNIELVMLLNGKKKNECRERITELIELVGLSEYTKTKVSKLSGGQKQRVAIARAMAKDAPIFVADEPTGNLDSESAESVMQLLHKISEDKLVIVVTHNYEQVERYATRKITMNDGRILEDRKLGTTSVTDENEYTHSDMKVGSHILLGARNTFNVTSKFVLLVAVYCFVVFAVIGLYASTMNTNNEISNLGFSSYYANISTNRAIVTKSDKTAFTDADIEKVKSAVNVDNVVKNDIGMDKVIDLNFDDTWISGPIFPISKLNGKDLTYGKLPEKDYEVVVFTDMNSWTYTELDGMGDSVIGRKSTVTDSKNGVQLLLHKVKIVGVVLDEGDETASVYGGNGYCKIYMNDTLANKILMNQMSTVCKTKVRYGNHVTEGIGSGMLFPTDMVPKGKVYITEDQLYHYTNEKALGKEMDIHSSCHYFDSDLKLTVDKVITKGNSQKLVGVSKENYDLYCMYAFINREDYHTLFDKGTYQVSVFMKDSRDSDQTVQDLNAVGYEVLLIKNTLVSIVDGITKIMDKLSILFLILEYIVIFFISYAVIRLVMRSRNTYYTTVRMLGGSKKNIKSLLSIELLFVMGITYLINMAFIYMTKSGIIKLPELKSNLYYLKPSDYLILLGIMVIMTLLLSRRYSRKIFGQSAMQAFREEV